MADTTPLESQDLRVDRSPEETRRRLARTPSLEVAASYRRTIRASLERVWENVFDWEHLPYLHDSAFAEIELVDSGSWGWHALVRFSGGDARSEIELVADREAGHYVARTLRGVGAGGEIWTQLQAKGPEATDIIVEFCTAEAPREQLDLIGRGSVALYQRLWDEDESMMRERQAALDAEAPEDPPPSLSLGSRESVRKRLPLDLQFGGRPYRIIELDGELVIYSSRCPHALGPLDDGVDASGKTICPWHGYEFDVRSGTSCDGRKLRLAPAPRIETDEASGEIRLHPLL